MSIDNYGRDISSFSSKTFVIIYDHYIDSSYVLVQWRNYRLETQLMTLENVLVPIPCSQSMIPISATGNNFFQYGNTVS